jgi:hypothetical protein
MRKFDAQFAIIPKNFLQIKQNARLFLKISALALFVVWIL